MIFIIHFGGPPLFLETPRELGVVLKMSSKCLMKDQESKLDRWGHDLHRLPPPPEH